MGGGDESTAPSSPQPSPAAGSGSSGGGGASGVAGAGGGAAGRFCAAWIARRAFRFASAALACARRAATLTADVIASCACF